MTTQTSLRPRVVLITGANRGIGLALTGLARARGDRVIALCRRSSPALDGSGAEIVTGVDLTQPAFADVQEALGDLVLDVSIHNAGIFEHDGFDDLDSAAIQRQMEINAFGPLRLVHALRSNLRPGSKLAFVTSRMGSIGDNGSGGYYGYRMSKAALNMAASSLAVDLKPSGVPVVVLHPGYVRTDMTGGAGQVDPETSARGLLARIDELTLARSGEFRHFQGERLPW